jgi:Enoyl-(Acyl carrier protein) reductase
MLPMMGRGGSIILVASAMHYMGLANHSTYAATKAALRSYSRTWTAEFKNSGIRANTLSPGVVDTRMLELNRCKPKAFRECSDCRTRILMVARDEYDQAIAQPQTERRRHTSLTEADVDTLSKQALIRLFEVVFRVWSNWQCGLTIVQPATVLRWRRRGFSAIPPSARMSTEMVALSLRRLRRRTNLNLVNNE